MLCGVHQEVLICDMLLLLFNTCQWPTPSAMCGVSLQLPFRFVSTSCVVKRSVAVVTLKITHYSKKDSVSHNKSHTL